MAARRGVFLALIESLRLHQWAKNLLIFVPLVLAGKSESVEAWTSCLLGFIALGVLASSTYIANDLWDIKHDRLHWSKRERPLARSLEERGDGLIQSIVLLALGVRHLDADRRVGARREL